MIRRDTQPNRKPRGSGSNITPGHVRAFQIVTSAQYEENIALWSCTINGEAGVAIVAVDRNDADTLAVMPLFVAITRSMKIEFEGGSEVTESEQGGGPVRADVVRDFDANKDILTPGGGA